MCKAKADVNDEDGEDDDVDEDTDVDEVDSVEVGNLREEEDAVEVEPLLVVKELSEFD